MLLVFMLPLLLHHHPSHHLILVLLLFALPCSHAATLCFPCPHNVSLDVALGQLLPMLLEVNTKHLKD